MNSNFNLDSFKRASSKMIATNEQSYNSSYSNRFNSRKLKDYTKDEIIKIINSGSIIEQQKLSRNYFEKDGFYKRIIMHYATLLKYEGVLIPNPAFGKSLSNTTINKRYYNAIDYVESMNLKTLLFNISLRALIDGCYYGVILELSKSKFAVLDLPATYCRSRFKDEAGNDIIEFDVSYFNTIFDEDCRKEALGVYPKIFKIGYRNWLKSNSSKWIIIPSDIGICFPLLGGFPFFLNVIPATIEYDNAVDVERERDLDEIRKILVQKIPHFTDGGLLFEPDEAESMHAAAVGMMKGNNNVSVLTTYNDVEAIVSKTQSDSVNNTLDKMMNNIYSGSGVSKEIFAASGSSSLPTSLKNDLALMMVLANRYSSFITSIINLLYANGNITFKYEILPLSYYNDKDYLDSTFKMAGTGYSFILPAIAAGISQRDLVNIKDLENLILKLDKKLIPLTSAYNSSNKESDSKVGRPALEDENKSPKTLINEESLENTNQGGSE